MLTDQKTWRIPPGRLIKKNQRNERKTCSLGLPGGVGVDAANCRVAEMGTGLLL